MCVSTHYNRLPLCIMWAARLKTIYTTTVCLTLAALVISANCLSELFSFAAGTAWTPKMGVCSSQSENLRNLGIALRILRILRLHSQFPRLHNTRAQSNCAFSESWDCIPISRLCTQSNNCAQSQDHIIYTHNLDIYVQTVSTFPLQLIVSNLACRMEDILDKHGLPP